MIYKLLTLALILSSCATQQDYTSKDRKVIIATFDAEDSAFESIERDEVAQYALDYRSHLFANGVRYKEDIFDCEDYVRGLIAYIMTHHKYTFSPAVGQSKAVFEGGAHMVLAYIDKKGKERYFDVQSGRDLTLRDCVVIYSRY